jgi:hypothetical protein
MKQVLFILFLFTCLAAWSQSKDEAEILSQSRLLQKTVFGTKDSVTLNGLFAKTLTYGHSGGKIENREEALHGIITNKSTYTDTSLISYKVMLNDDVAIVRFIMREMETKPGAQPAPLNLAIMLVWTKEKGKWKLFGRQAVKLQ